MWRRFRPDPDEFQSAVNLLCSKIQTIALRSDISHVDCELGGQGSTRVPALLCSPYAR